MRGLVRRWPLLLLVIATVPLIAGCDAPHKEIDAIGVVSASDWTTGGDEMVNTIGFDDGRTYEMRYERGAAGYNPTIGDLIIAGSRPTIWMLVAPPRIPAAGWQGPCYGLQENGEERDTSVELDFGVTLQKAPDFDERGRNPKSSTRIFGGVICLNRDGQVRMIF